MLIDCTDFSSSIVDTNELTNVYDLPTSLWSSHSHKQVTFTSTAELVAVL